MNDFIKILLVTLTGVGAGAVAHVITEEVKLWRRVRRFEAEGRRLRTREEQPGARHLHFTP